MLQFNFDNFLLNVEEDLKEARKIASELGEAELSKREENYSDSSDSILHDVTKDFNEYALNECIRRAITKVRFALEVLSLPNLLQNFNEVISNYKTYHDQFEYISYVDALINPVIRDIQEFVDAITSQIDPKKIQTNKFDEEIILLEQMLSGTPKIISDRKIEPSSEAEIRKAVYEHLIHVFPDTVREIPIAKVSKTYKPDIGIKKLKAAIEYKFANTEAELKTCIGGIFEDMKGYTGSEDWKTFYAVIYQTDHFMTSAQIMAEFELSEVQHNWKAILVYGKGQRNTKTKNTKKI